MNRRINKIILDILHEKNYPLEKYAKLFNVTEQTIRNDINEINQEFQMNNYGKILLDHTGTITLTPGMDWTNILKAYSSFQRYRLTQNERRTILAFLLMTTPEFVTTYYLSEYVLVSRNTLLSDIEELKKWFARNSLVLYSKVGKGYIVKGDEANIRDAMLKLIMTNGLFVSDYDHVLGDENNIFQNLVLDIVDKNNIYPTIKNLLIQSERRHDLQLSDFSYKEVTWYLLIMVDRLHSGQIINWSCDGDALMNSSKYEFAKDLADSIEEEFDVKVPDREKLHLTSLLRQKSYIKNNGRKIESIEIQILINEFIYDISSKFNIKYYLNSELFDLLENHLKLSLLRIKNNDIAKNDMLSEIKESYQEIFPVIKASLVNIEKYLEKEFSEDEVSFIVMYVMAIIENSMSEQPVIKARLVCNSGRGTAQLLKVKIQTLFPQVQIMSVDSSHDVSINKRTSQDLTISTIPISDFQGDLVIVNPIMTEDDVVAIQKAVHQLQVKKATENSIVDTVQSRKDEIYEMYLQVIDKYIDARDKEIALSELESMYFSYFSSEKKFKTANEFTRISDLLTIDRIRLDVSVSDWKEAIIVAGKLLLKENLITEQYIKAMIDIVTDLDSYIVIYPGVAIPHADSEDGVLKTGASFVRLKEAVAFNHYKNDPVKYVIAFSVIEPDKIGKSLYNLTEVLGSGKFDEKLGTCRSSDELLYKLKILENEVMGISNEKNII